MQPRKACLPRLHALTTLSARPPFPFYPCKDVGGWRWKPAPSFPQFSSCLGESIPGVSQKLSPLIGELSAWLPAQGPRLGLLGLLEQAAWWHWAGVRRTEGRWGCWFQTRTTHWAVQLVKIESLSGAEGLEAMQPGNARWLYISHLISMEQANITLVWVGRTAER